MARVCSPSGLHTRLTRSATPNSMTAYYIQAHVHFAVAADAIVFMDLRSDQYSMLTGQRAHSFLSMLHITGASIIENCVNE